MHIYIYIYIYRYIYIYTVELDADTPESSCARPTNGSHIYTYIHTYIYAYIYIYIYLYLCIYIYTGIYIYIIYRYRCIHTVQLDAEHAGKLLRAANKRHAGGGALAVGAEVEEDGVDGHIVDAEKDECHLPKKGRMFDEKKVIASSERREGYDTQSGTR